MPQLLSKFAVRVYLIVFTFSLMLLSVWLLFIFPIERQHSIASHLEASGADVKWEVGGAAWLEKLVDSYWYTEVVSVDLSRCENPKEMLPWLPGLRSLQHVDLSYSDLLDEDLRSLTKLRSLVALKIDGNERLTDQGVVHLEKLSNLQWLEYSAPIGKQGLDSLSKNPDLVLGKLTVEQVSLKDLLKFPALSKVNELHIKSPIGDDWPEAVMASRNVLWFELTDASVNREQLHTIIHKARISLLHLTNVRLEELALPILAEEAPRLQGVSLKDTNVTYEQMFARLGPNASSIVFSDGGASMQMNHSGWPYVHWEGKRPIANISLLSRCENCTYLRVNGPLRPNWELSVLGSMPALTGIDLQSPISDDDLLCISQVKQLSAIELSGPLTVTPRGMAHLQNTKCLKSLTLFRTSLDENHFQEIGKLKSLQELSFSETLVTSGGMAYLKGLQSLESLTLNDCKSLEDSAMSHIAKLNSLKHLEIDTVPITDQGLLHLLGMPNLETVSIARTECTEEGQERLRKMLPSYEFDPFLFWDMSL